ncbi:MAG: serine hydrolase domain-containing protein [Candidatus Aminicenantaceae bacterium]
MKMLCRLKIVFTIVLLLNITLLAAADVRTDKVDRLLSQWDNPNSPGCALAIIKDGKIMYKRGYGMSNLELNVLISPKTVFYTGSVSKQFVAMSIALLAEKGMLSLEDDISKYIPEMPDYGTPIKIRHLVNHTSGLRDYLSLLDIAGIDFGSFHEEDVIELISRQKELNFKPGEKYLYSNSGYFLMAVIVERVSGKSLRQFAEENIFRPLKMKNSHFHDDYTVLIKNRASGYFPAGKKKFKNFISTFDCVGSGGLFTSVEDLFLWDQNFYHYKVGGKDVIELMHTRGTLNSGKEINYAFALNIGNYKGLKTVSHGGALGGYRSALIRFPEQNFSVICLSNLSSFNPMRISQKVADIYLADYFKEVVKSEKKPEEDMFIKLPQAKLKEKVGTYIQPKSENMIRLFMKDGTLFFRIHDQNYPLAAVSETEFQALNESVNFLLKFERQSKGKPLLLHVHQEGEKPATYELFKMPQLTPGQFNEYAGDYYSEELQVFFKLRLKKGELYFVHKNAPGAPLQPTFKDKFNVKGFKIHFIRNDKNEISGFRLDAGRVKNLMFDIK